MIAILMVTTLVVSGFLQSSMLVEISPQTIRTYEVNLPGGGTAERCVPVTPEAIERVLNHARAAYPNRHQINRVESVSCGDPDRDREPE